MPGSPSAGSRVSPAVVVLPADPTGHHLAGVVREIGCALRAGDVVVDTSRVQERSPGLLLALTRLHRVARARGRSWSEI